MSLRRRLLITVLSLLTVGMVAGGAITYGAMREYLVGRADDRLNTVGKAAERALAVRPRPDLTGNDTDLLRAVAGTDLFFQIRSATGTVVQSADSTDGPRLPARLLPAVPSPGRPDGAVLHDVGDADWRVRVSRLTDGQVLVVGLRLSEVHALSHRLGKILMVVTAICLVAVALLALRAIRIALRPLDRIADTARQIGDGDLGRRVATADPRTEVGRVATALNAMLARIEEALLERSRSEERLRRFIADASHELRTPVATIRGYAELFRRGAADRPADLALAMGRIESESQRMGQLVDELLLLARLDQGRPLEQQPVDLADLAAEAVADLRVVDPGRPVELDRQGPAIVTGDPARLRQVLDNLLANLRQHTPQNAPATVRVRREGEFAVLEVSDQGPGLTTEQSTHVFERFYRAEASTTNGRNGAGLGLAIVAAVAHAHGGEATVDSRPNEGACFQIRIPATP